MQECIVNLDPTLCGTPRAQSTWKLVLEDLPHIIENPIKVFFRPKSCHFSGHQELIDVL